MKINRILFLVGLAVAAITTSTAQQRGNAPTLAEIKIAADAGDPVAQTDLAERMGYGSAECERLLRKAADQNYAPAQGKLGHMLLNRSRMSLGRTPEQRAALGKEALKWSTLAAGQGNKRGQADLASIFLEGKLVKQDLIEAYKWGDLATEAGPFDTAGVGGRSWRDQAILKMNAEQMAEARRRVAAFVPRQLTEPPWLKEIKLKGINGPAERRMAMINNQTFMKGDVLPVSVGDKKIQVRCVEVHADSVLVAIEGVAKVRELRMD